MVENVYILGDELILCSKSIQIQIDDIQGFFVLIFVEMKLTGRKKNMNVYRAVTHFIHSSLLTAWSGSRRFKLFHNTEKKKRIPVYAGISASVKPVDFVYWYFIYVTTDIPYKYFGNVQKSIEWVKHNLLLFSFGLSVKWHFWKFCRLSKNIQNFWKKSDFVRKYCKEQ